MVIKPSSDTPTIAAKFAEVLLDAGFPPQSFSMLVGSGAVVGDVLVEHPKTRFIAFTGSKEVGLRINELAAKPHKGQIWIKRVIAEMGGKDAIVVDREADLDSAVQRRAVVGVRLPGPEVFGLFARDRGCGHLRRVRGEVEGRGRRLEGRALRTSRRITWVR